MSAAQPARIAVHIRRIVYDANVGRDEPSVRHDDGSPDTLAESIHAAVRAAISESPSSVAMPVTAAANAQTSLAVAIARSVVSHPALSPYFSRFTRGEIAAPGRPKAGVEP